MGKLVAVVVIFFLACCGFGILKGLKRAKLKQQYEQALQGTDKALALNLGRAYYATFNKGNVVTAADEARIANELSTMKV